MPNRIHRQLAALAAATLIGLFGFAGTVNATSIDDTSIDDTAIDDTSISNTAIDGATNDTVYQYDLENDPSECINFLPRPNCGKVPEDAGERGGALQYATFGVMLAGIGVIAFVVGRNVIRRDREMNRALAEKNTTDTQ